MKKLLIAGGAIAGAAYLARRQLSSDGGFDFGQWIERMARSASCKCSKASVGPLDAEAACGSRRMSQEKMSRSCAARD
jgi:hypothetical protein